MAGTQKQKLVVPSPHARSRLRWTRQLHERFVEAVSMLGGANKATPKAVKSAMGVPGLTLFHLKSHLQKHRLAVRRSNHEANFNYGEEADCSEEESQRAQVYIARNQSHANENMLQRNLEVKRKLDEQIEVQRHLQLRIEAQGRYLQSAMRRAQEMLASYNLDSAAMEAAAGSELSGMVSAVDTECLSSSCSGGNYPAQPWQADCSGDSCLTCWETPEVEEDKLRNQETGLLHHSSGKDADDISSDVGKPIANVVGWGCSILCEDSSAQGLPGCSSSRHSPQRKSRCRVSEEIIDLNTEPTYVSVTQILHS